MDPLFILKTVLRVFIIYQAAKRRPLPARDGTSTACLNVINTFLCCMRAVIAEANSWIESFVDIPSLRAF